MSEVAPTTPIEPPTHGAVPRGLASTPSSSTTSGRFGRMFRRLPVYELDPIALVELGKAMIQPLENGQLDKPLGEPDEDENTSTLADGELRLPAGYTYFGQFVDHDITFDPVSSLTRQNDPDGLVDFRTPRFDLDSLYGRGPADQPYLYEGDGLRLKLGRDVAAGNPAVNGPDLQRNDAGRALIGDPRNDENLIVSQLQVAFLKFHNAVVEKIAADNASLAGVDQFKLAQLTVRWHYQWVVVHDFLPRLVGDDVVKDILRGQEYVSGGKHSVVRPLLRFYNFRERPFMPVEFSVAAYRYGHSMARPSYLINDVAVADPQPANASRIPLFVQGGSERDNLNGFRRLPDEWGLQWKYFLVGINDVAGPRDEKLPQPSYKIDHELGHPLGALPESVAKPELFFPGMKEADAQSLAVRNLLRGRALGLPSGPDIARAMGLDPIKDTELFDGLGLAEAIMAELKGRAPLWFYVLREAELRAESSHLGPVGGRIVAEVLIGLLDADPLSYLSVFPGWTPTLKGRKKDHFSLSDIINAGLPPPTPTPNPAPYPS